LAQITRTRGPRDIYGRPSNVTERSRLIA
jgi:hypothetical protein